MIKIKNIAFIVFVLVIFASAGVVAVLMGTRADDTIYVCLESKARLEILTDTKGYVQSFKPLNTEAEALVAGEEIYNHKVDEVASKFVDLSIELGYMNMEKGDNVIKVTVLSSLMQAYQNRLVKSVYKAIVNNNVLCVVTESQNDLQNFKNASRAGVDAEKYDLIMACKENGLDNEAELKKLSSRQIIDKIKETHSPRYTDSEQSLAQKQNLIEQNKLRYEEHMSSIDAQSTKEFREQYNKYLQQNTHKFDANFDFERAKIYG